MLNLKLAFVRTNLKPMLQDLVITAVQRIR